MDDKDRNDREEAHNPLGEGSILPRGAARGPLARAGGRSPTAAPPPPPAHRYNRPSPGGRKRADSSGGWG